jgi:hypothetical protein
LTNQRNKKNNAMKTQPDLIDLIIAYEQGDLSDYEMVNLFAELVRNGMAWSLQGHYGRTAASLIDAGYIDREGNLSLAALELEN